jgi:tetratricopeptide (TPR) repeat protein
MPGVRDTSGLYSTDTLAEAIGVPAERICVWISEGLLEPSDVVAGTYYFSFKQMSAARTLRELADSGANLKKLRRGMKRLRRWLPEARPQERIVSDDVELHVRLDGGELAETDGQLRLEFAGDATSLPITRAPQTADGWFDVGVAHEAAGELHAAIEAYRAALRVGGTSAKIAFALAHALAEAGLHDQAAERYAQVLELDPGNADAWNNVGVILSALGQHEAARRAYCQSLEIRPDDARVHFNLADALDEIGRNAEAAPHWRAYLRHDASSAWAAHARRRLAMT